MMRDLLALGVFLMMIVPADASASSPKTHSLTTVQRSAWGKTIEGASVDLWDLNDGVVQVVVSNLGARIVRVLAPDRDGHSADVVLGYKDVASYEADTKTYVGAVVGRYGNRIANGRFSIDGHPYQIPTNNNGNALHGGPEGFDRKTWDSKPIPNGVEFTLVSPDGDMGFPGRLTTHVRYTLEGNALKIQYSATTDKPTVVNLTNHSYFNLAGESSGTVLNHLLKLDAKKFTAVDAGLIPTGKSQSVVGTPFDFRASHRIGDRIDTDNDQLKLAGGYDHNFLLLGHGLREVAQVIDPQSGRMLTVDTTEPGVQFYSGNFLEGATTGVGGVPYVKYAGFCLETQHYPDSPNEPSFPSTLLRPGQIYRSTTIFHFSVAAAVAGTASGGKGDK